MGSSSGTIWRLEQCPFIPLMSGQTRPGLEDSDGWNPARATVSRGTMRPSEGCGEPVPLQVPFCALGTDPAETPVMSYCSLSSTSPGKAENFIFPYSLTDISMSLR